MARILFTSTPGVGHVSPMRPLARAFVARGHEVAFATAAGALGHLANDPVATIAAGWDPIDPMVAIAERYPELASLAPAEKPAFMFQRLFGDMRARPMLDDLLPAARAFGPDVLVCDQAELAGPLVAAILGVPNVTHGFGSVLPRERIESVVPYVEPLWAEHGLDLPPGAGTYAHLYLDIYPPSLSAADTSHLPDVVRLRPTELPAVDPEPEDPPHVYVTFGTVFTDTDRFAEVVAGAAAHDVRVTATVGSHKDPEVLGPQPDHVTVERFVPQAELLPRCSAVVSHGGSGTFLATLAHALPQVVVPLGADQFLNAAAGAHSGAAVVVDAVGLDRAAVADALGRVLTDASFRDAARRCADEIAAMPSPDEAAGVIEQRYSLLTDFSG